MYERAAEDEDFRESLLTAARNDFAFFCNAFLYVQEPRKRKGRPQVAPFILWDFQEDYAAETIDAIGVFESLHTRGHDLGCDKSRDMGVTWVTLAVFVWHWWAMPFNKLMVVSRAQELVDQADDPDCLFEKMRFMIRRLPAWMQKEKKTRSQKGTWRTKKNQIKNLENGSVLTGTATTKDIGRGGRSTAVFVDEFASFNEQGKGTDEAMWSATTAHTDCRIVVSTHKGAATLFFELKDRGDMRWTTLIWWRHPDKSRGMYVNHEGEKRSPWYDEEEKRCANIRERKQEIDCDPMGSKTQFFDDDLVKSHMRVYVRDPFGHHRIRFDLDTSEFYGIQDVEKGSEFLKTWCDLDSNGYPPLGRYGVSADIAVGTKDESGRGYSNSCAVAVNLETGVKVAELIRHGVRPEEFAAEVMAMGRMFCDPGGSPAYLIWEKNGPGEQFGHQVMQIGYSPIYFMTDEERLVQKQSDRPGWQSNAKNKTVLLGRYARSLALGTFINRSIQALRECGYYTQDASGDVMHEKAKATNDPTQARANHGDRVIADALANKLVELIGVRVNKDEQEQAKQVIPLDTFQSRREQYNREQQDEYAW